MVILDIVLLMCFVPAIILGISKGFIKQVTELIALILGCWAGVHYTTLFTSWLSQHITMDSRIMSILCFILILIAAAAVFTLIGEALTKLFKAVSLGWVNRLMGMVFGIIKTAFIMGLAIILFEGLNSSLGNPVKQRATKDSVVYNTMKKVAQETSPSLKALIIGNNNG